MPKRALEPYDGQPKHDERNFQGTPCSLNSKSPNMSTPLTTSQCRPVINPSDKRITSSGDMRISELITTFPNLETLHIDDWYVYFGTCCIQFCAPALQKLSICTSKEEAFQDLEKIDIKIDFSKMGILRLRELVLNVCGTSKSIHLITDGPFVIDKTVLSPGKGKWERTRSQGSTWAIIPEIIVNQSHMFIQELKFQEVVAICPENTQIPTANLEFEYCGFQENEPCDEYYPYFENHVSIDGTKIPGLQTLKIHGCTCNWDPKLEKFKDVQHLVITDAKELYLSHFPNLKTVALGEVPRNMPFTIKNSPKLKIIDLRRMYSSRFSSLHSIAQSLTKEICREMEKKVWNVVSEFVSRKNKLEEIAPDELDIPDLQVIPKQILEQQEIDFLPCKPHFSGLDSLEVVLVHPQHQQHLRRVAQSSEWSWVEKIQTSLAIESGH